MAQDSATKSSPTKKPRSDRRIRLIFVAVIIVAMAVVYFQQRQPPELRGWGEDLDAGIAEAGRRNTKVLVFFTRSPPGYWDVRMIKEPFRWRPVLDVLERLNYVQVRQNLEDHSVAAEKYGVTEGPTMLLLDSRGKLLKKRSGFMRGETLCNDFLGVPMLASPAKDSGK